jgi:hypothetical protein
VVWEYTFSDAGSGMTRINSLGFNPDLGDSGYVSINVNELNQIMVVDKATKSLVYTYNITTGNLIHASKWVTKYFIGTNIPMPDANVTAMRTNNIVVVNNSLQVVEFNPVAKAFVKNIPFSFSAHEGSVQRLPNGNTLVNAANKSAVELSDDGTKIRTITLPGTVARAYMYGPSYPGLKNYTKLASALRPVAAAANFNYNPIAHSGKITVQQTEGQLLTVRIFASNGRMVHAAACRGNEAVFSTAALPTGVYIVESRHAAGSFTANVIKDR